MPEYGFLLNCIFPYKDRTVDSVLIRENTGQWKPVFSHILCSVIKQLFWYSCFCYETSRQLGNTRTVIQRVLWKTFFFFQVTSILRYRAFNFFLASAWLREMLIKLQISMYLCMYVFTHNTFNVRIFPNYLVLNLPKFADAYITRN